MRGFWLSLALGCVLVPSATVTVERGSATRNALPAEFELVSWNVHKQRHRDAAAEFAQVAARADVVLLQEAVGPGPTVGHSWTFVEAFRFVRSGSPAGVASGVAAVSTSSYGLRSEVREPFSSTPKSALVTTVPFDGGGELLLVNLHGINFRRAEALENQLARVQPFVSRHTGPVVVAGDFNTWSSRRRRVVRAFAKRCGLKRVFTGDAAPRLDAVFHRGLETTHAEVIPTRTSDHDALRVGFRVARP